MTARRWALVVAVLGALLWTALPTLADDGVTPTTVALEEPWYSVGEDGVTRIVLWAAYSSTCPHCQAALPWLATLDDLGWIEVRFLQMNGDDPTPVDMAIALAASIGEQVQYVPTFMYCSTLEYGFDAVETTGVELLAHLEACRNATLSPTTSTTLSGSATTVPAATTTTSPVSSPSTVEGTIDLAEESGPDMVANGIAIALLVVMIESLIAAPLLAWRGRLRRGALSLVFLLAVVGLAVATYLAHVETTGVRAVCGPIGDCNAVQQSSYARLFGAVPIGIVGLVGFGAVLLVWGVVVVARSRTSDLARVALGVGAIAGVAFSVYLTFLEPFVIGAVCAWCLASAAVATGLVWVTAGPAATAWRRLHDRSTPAV
jgi:uncharacterized membrane protein/thiol-disulfide isomerase/thioredoxin